jgi:hypothetical protein
MSNLATQFKPGQSGNPKGGPKKEWTMGGILRESLEEEDETGVSYKIIIVRKLRALASRGDMVAIKEINNRMDGMPKQAVEHSGSIELPTPIYNGKSTDTV